MPPRPIRSVAVVGGGIAGLVAALELAGRGDQVVVLEASDQFGGAVRSASMAGILIDVGAESFGVARPDTSALITELGLADSVIAPRRSDARISLAQGLFAMPHAMLGIPTDLGSDAVVAILGEAAAAHARELDARPLSAIDSSVTLGDLVRSRMGDDVVSQIVLPVVAGVHAIDPDLVEADAVIPGILRATQEEGSLAGAAARLRSASGIPGAAVAGLVGGMTVLIDALVEENRALGTELFLNTPVVSALLIGSRWSLTLASGEIRECDDLVVAIDAPAAAALLHDLPAVADPLAAIPVGDVAVVALVVDEPALDSDPIGSGLLHAPNAPESSNGESGESTPRIRAKAMTHTSAKWEWVRSAYGPGRHVVRLSYGRNGKIEEDLDELPEIAARDLATILGLANVKVVEAKVVRWSTSLVQPRPGHRARVVAVRSAADAVPNLAVVGAGLGGNGLAGTIASARSVTAQLA